MKTITLFWCGPFSIKIETPFNFEGEKGVFSLVHKNNVIYIGKANSRNALFRESKRYNKIIECLNRNGIIPKDLYIGNPKAYDYVDQNVVRYVAPIKTTDDIEDTEYCLIFNHRNKLICNYKGKKKYLGCHSVSIINKGCKPDDLPLQISCIKELAS